MTWHTWKPALALGAMLAASGVAFAAERDTQLLSGERSTTMTLGGKSTLEQAATEDNELTHGYRYRNYYGWGGGWGGYRGYYGGYRGYYGGYYNSFSYYRPAYYYTPRYYYPTYYRSYPTYASYYYGGCGPSIGFTFGIGGNAVALSAPTVTLGGGFTRPAAQPMAQPVAPGDGTFPYDGGPANPVPAPKPDAQPIPPANPSDLPISSKPKTSPYKYKAYGEK